MDFPLYIEVVLFKRFQSHYIDRGIKFGDLVLFIVERYNIIIHCPFIGGSSLRGSTVPQICISLPFFASFFYASIACNSIIVCTETILFEGSHQNMELNEFFLPSITYKINTLSFISFNFTFTSTFFCPSFNQIHGLSTNHNFLLLFAEGMVIPCIILLQ